MREEYNISMDTTNEVQKENVHSVLAYSYSVYVLAFLLGIALYILIPTPEPKEELGIIGMVILGIGTLLVFWAQSTSRTTRPHRNDGEPVSTMFAQGPYKITRSPTHLGLALMILAFAFFANSYLIALVALGAYSITRMHFIKKEEALLLQKYGNAYQDYKRKVTW